MPLSIPVEFTHRVFVLVVHYFYLFLMLTIESISAENICT